MTACFASLVIKATRCNLSDINRLSRTRLCRALCKLQDCTGMQRLVELMLKQAQALDTGRLPVYLHHD